MTIFTYARVSTLDQNTKMQEEALMQKYPTSVLRIEKASGTTMTNRPVLNLLIEMVQEGDKLVVWKLDRLARDMNDLTNIVSEMEKKGAALEILDQAIDTSTAAGKAFLQMLGVFAEFETNLRKERQLAGIRSAKEAGRHLGRRPVFTGEQIDEIKIKAKSLTVTQLAAEYDVARGTIYNALKG